LNHITNKSILALLLVLTGCATTATQPQAQGDGPQLVVTIRDEAPGLSIGPGATPELEEPGANYRGSAYAQRVSRRLQRNFGLKEVDGWRIGLLNVYCVVYRTTGANLTAQSMLARLAAHPDVESVQLLNNFATRASYHAYDDPYFRLQSGLGALRVPEAQRWSAGDGIRVAVVDTGVDTMHPDLANRIESSRDFVANNPGARVAERHGTAVAGAIAAVANNGIGIVGVAPNARLLVLRACWQDGPQAQGQCNSLTLARALEFAINRRANVINLSLTGPRDALLERLVALAIERDIVVVGAADRPNEFPSSVPGVVAVGDADARSAVANKSQPGQSLGAPGREILTLVPDGHYDFVSGSSMSAALASGVVALVLSAQRDLRTAVHQPGNMVSLLQRTAQTELASGRAGLRLIDACQALAERTGRPPCARDTPVAVSGPALGDTLGRK
jgi:subtilisin family serine protease